MSNQRFKIPRASDKRVAEGFAIVANEYPVAHAHASALGYSDLGQIDLKAPTGAWATLLSLDSYLLINLTLHVAGLAVVYHRGGDIAQEHKSPIYDEISFSQLGGQQQPGLVDERLKVLALMSSFFAPYETGRVPGSALTEEQSDLLAIHQSTLERLEGLNEDLVRRGAEFRSSLENTFTQKTAELEKQLNDRRVVLEEQVAVRSQELDARDTELREAQKKLDDRNNTHVRRAIRDSMLSDVKSRIESFGVSKNTEKKRLPVFAGFVALATTFILLLLVTISEIWSNHSTVYATAEQNAAKAIELYVLWARGSLLSLGLFGTILYYIRWQNRWAEQHAASEFQLQQFYVDVNRANWVMESCLEWRKETQQSRIPKALIESITRNLFVKDGGESEPVVHPADELASALMGSASKLKLKVGNSELDFDKPQKIPKKTPQ